MSVKFIYIDNFNYALIKLYGSVVIWSVIAFFLISYFIKRGKTFVVYLFAAFLIFSWVFFTLPSTAFKDYIYEVTYSNLNNKYDLSYITNDLYIQPAMVKTITSVCNDFNIKFTVNDDGILSEANSNNYIEINLKFDKISSYRIDRHYNSRSGRYNNKVHYTKYQISSANLVLCHNGVQTIYDTRMFRYKCAMCC